MKKTYEVDTPNRLVPVPEPGILFTRDNAVLAYHALKYAREYAASIPEQDELCDELAALLFPARGEARPAEGLVPSATEGGHTAECVRARGRAWALNQPPLPPCDCGRNPARLTPAQVAELAGPELISAARSWAADCQWLDSEEIADLTDAQVVAGVQQHYDGGWAQFTEDSQG